MKRPSWQSWRTQFQSALRYKLLALVLLPLMAAMAVTLAYTLYWFHGYTRDSAHLAMRDYLIVARQTLRQFQDERQLELQQLADSTTFRALLRQRDTAAIQRTLQRLRDARNYGFLHVTGVAGNWIYEGDGERTSKPSPLADRAARGFGGSALEVFRADDLRREPGTLADNLRTEPRARDGREPRALILRVVQPIVDDQGHVFGLLDAGLLLNRDQAFLYMLGNRVFTPGALPGDASPIVSLALDDARIAAAGEMADRWLGSPLPSDSVARSGSGDVAIVREVFDGRAYVSTYGGLYDVNGQLVGRLHVGVREDALTVGYYRATTLLLLLFLIATAAAAWIAVRGVRSVLIPIETMAAVARATQAGEDRRIGPIDSRDEVGALARQFDTMLDQLAVRNREIQRAAAALEVKVAERTSELEQKNAELEQTIALLERTQAQLVLADKLSALGQMAAGIAHEINNPAAVILGNLDVISAELGPKAAPVVREIELIASQVDRIRHIVTSLLQFARARSGPSEIAEVQVNQLVQDVLPLVAHTLKGKSISLRQRLDAQTAIAVNPFDLEQVLINLIANAAHACDVRGTIEITTADAPDGGAIIGVRDDGCGIAPDDLKRLFDPFFTTDPQRGAGLGLSVSYGLVQRYGGTLTVESSLGAGSIFRVHLPQRPPVSNERAQTTALSEEVNYG